MPVKTQKERRIRIHIFCRSSQNQIDSDSAAFFVFDFVANSVRSPRLNRVLLGWLSTYSHSSPIHVKRTLYHILFITGYVQLQFSSSQCIKLWVSCIFTVVVRFSAVERYAFVGIAARIANFWLVICDQRLCNLERFVSVGSVPPCFVCCYKSTVHKNYNCCVDQIRSISFFEMDQPRFSKVKYVALELELGCK